MLLQRDTDLRRLEAVRRGYQDGKIPVAPPAVAGIEQFSPEALEVMTTPEDIYKLALRIWSDTRQADPQTRQQMPAEARERYSDKLAPYDLDSLFRQVDELFKTLG